MVTNFRSTDIHNHFLGPATHIDDINSVVRKTTPFSQNETFSSVPDMLQHNIDETEAVKVERIMLRMILRCLDKEQLKVELSEQFESRIAIFCMQMFLVYKTNVTIIPVNSADAQHGRGGTYDDVPDDEYLNDIGNYQAAHAANITRFYIECEDEDYAIAFGKWSSFHASANSTRWLPKFVNDLDSKYDRLKRIDGLTLRQKCIKILQNVADGATTPMKGLTEFLDTSEEYLKEVRGDLKTSRNDIRMGRVISEYRAVIKYYRNNLLEDGLFKILFGHVKSEKKGCKLYLKIQKGMHNMLITEMKKVKKYYPEEELKSNTTADFKPDNVTSELIHGKVKPYVLGPTAHKYVKCCSQDRKIGKLVSTYLEGISQKQLMKDISNLIVCVNPKSLMAIHRACSKLITTTYQKERYNNAYLITAYVLRNLSQNQ